MMAASVLALAEPPIGTARQIDTARTGTAQEAKMMDKASFGRTPVKALALGMAMGFVTLLSACVGMESAMKDLRGHDISAAVDRLGFPNDQREMLGHTVYRWNSGDQYGGAWCNLSIVVDRSNKIITGSWDGNVAGCAGLASRLD